jgi:hypothetical protein
MQNDLKAVGIDAKIERLTAQNYSAQLAKQKTIATALGKWWMAAGGSSREEVARSRWRSLVGARGFEPRTSILCRLSL